MKVSSRLSGFLFTELTISFSMQKLFSFVRSQLPVVSSISRVNRVLVRKSLPSLFSILSLFFKKFLASFFYTCIFNFPTQFVEDAVYSQMRSFGVCPSFIFIIVISTPTKRNLVKEEIYLTVQF